MAVASRQLWSFDGDDADRGRRVGVRRRRRGVALALAHRGVHPRQPPAHRDEPLGAGPDRRAVRAGARPRPLSPRRTSSPACSATSCRPLHGGRRAPADDRLGRRLGRDHGAHRDGGDLRLAHRAARAPPRRWPSTSCSCSGSGCRCRRAGSAWSTTRRTSAAWSPGAAIGLGRAAFRRPAPRWLDATVIAASFALAAIAFAIVRFAGG